MSAQSGLPLDNLERLLKRYGSCVNDLLSLIATQPSLAVPVEGGGDVLAAEIVYACTHEGARHLEDVLVRRTRIAILTSDGGASASEGVLALMQDALGWSEARTELEQHSYRRLLTTERQALST